MKVLVTGAGALLGQGIIKSLRASSLGPRVVAVDPSPLAAGLYWADAAYLVPLADDPHFLGRFREVLAAERPDAVLVGTDVELAVLAAHRGALEREFQTQILVSDPGVIATADDKWLTYQFLKRHRFDCPQSCLAGDEERLIDAVGFPLVVKPRVGARSVGVRVVYDRAGLSQALAVQPGAIVQECVGSSETEYTAGALHFAEGGSASIVMRRHLRDGNTYRAFVNDHAGLRALVCTWAERLGPHGPVNFQFRLDGDDRAKVFEINARFSGTTPLRARAGFNEVDMALRYLLRGEPIAQPRIKPMVVLRHWDETVVEPADLLN